VKITYQQKHTDEISVADHADLASRFAEASLDDKDKKIEAGQDK